MSQITPDSAIPIHIRRKLTSMLWRARVVAVVRGSALVTAALLTALLLAIGADHFLMGYVERYIIVYEWPVRLAVTVGILLVAIVATGLAVVRPLVRRFSDSGIAQTIEEHHPELEERLSSTVELLASKDPEVLRGSDEMIGMLTDQASDGARVLKLGGIISWDRAARYWALAGLIALIAGAIAFRWPGPFMLSLQRLFVANLERVGQAELAILGEGDRVVPEGEPMMIRAEARGGSVKSAWLLIRGQDDRLQTRKMDLADAEAGVFAVTIGRAFGTWLYQVRSGDSHTRWYTVRAVPRPYVMGTDVTVTPPAYSRRPVRNLENLPDTLKVLRYSQIELDVTTNKPVAYAVLEFDRDRPIELEPDAEREHHYLATLTAMNGTSFRILLADEHKLDNVSPARHRIRVVRDEPPSVSIVQPGRRVTLQATDSLPIRFMARDDLAITQAELIVTVGVDEPVVLPIELPKRRTRRMEQDTTLDLAQVGVAHARQVTYRVRVSDSLPSDLDNGPQTAVSAEHEIMIDAAANSFKMQVLQSVRKQFKTALDQITELLKTSQKQTAALKTSAGKKEAYTPEQEEQTEAVRESLRKAEKLAGDINELTAYTDYRNLGSTLGTEIAKRHIAPAEQLVTQAKLLTREHAERADRFGRAEFEIQRALEKLAALTKQFDDAAIYQETAQALADAAARQADLADRIKRLSEVEAEAGALPLASQPAGSQPAGMEAQQEARAAAQQSPTTGPVTTAPSDPADLMKLTKEQQELIKATQEMIALNPEMWHAALEVQQARSKTLLEQLEDLGKRQDELTKLVNEQQTRDKAKANREQLAKALKALGEQVAKLSKDRADLLKQAAAAAPDPQKLAQAAEKVSGEELAQASSLQAESEGALARIQQAAAAAAKKLTQQAPDPKPHQKLAGTARELAGQAVKLAQQQRHLATETGKTAQQRQAQQQSLTQAQAKVQTKLAERTKQQQALAGETAAWVGKIDKHAPLASALAGALKKSSPAATAKQAADQVNKKQLDQAASTEESVAKQLEAMGKSIAESAKQARHEGERIKAQTAKWKAAEAKRLAAVKAYEAETARRKQAVDKWRVDEANRKAALAKWLTDEQAKRKAAATQMAKKPAPTTQQKPTTKPATTQKAAVPKPPPPPQPPKALATPIPEPRFGALAKPADKPAPKPQPKQALWNEGQLKSADALAAEAAALAKRQRAAREQTVAAAKQAKQSSDQATALTQQIAKQDASLLKQQRDLQRAASQLMQRAVKIVPPVKDAVQANTPIPPMQAAGEAIKKHDLPPAPKSQVAAAERLEAINKALAGASDQATAAAAAAAKAADEARRQAQAQQELAKQARQLHQQQAQARKQTERLAKRLAPLGPLLKDKVIGDLTRQQDELAKEATKLSDELATPQQADGVELPAQPDPVAQTAAMAAQKTSEAMKAMAAGKPVPGQPEGDASQAAAAEKVRGLQQNVAAQLDRIVDRLNEPVELDPARWEQQATEEYLRVQQAERAAELAARQRRLSRQLEQAAAGKPMQAIAIEQDQLREKVGDFALAAEFLAEQVEAMEPKVAAVKPKILANAKQATELLTQTAPTAMASATKELEQDHASQAIKPMGEARKALTQAHKLLGTLQGQLAKAASDAPAGQPSDEEMSRRLTESLEDQYDALRRMLEAQDAAADATMTDPTEAAAQALRERLTAQAARAAANANAARMQASAREFMEAAWEAAGETNIDPDKAVIMPGAPTGGGNWRIVVPDSTILDLEVIGLTRSDWARLPGTLREEVIQAAEEKAPAEYREVIKRYFQAISQQAGADWNNVLLDEPTKPATPAKK